MFRSNHKRQGVRARIMVPRDVPSLASGTRDYGTLNCTEDSVGVTKDLGVSSRAVSKHKGF